MLKKVIALIFILLSISAFANDGEEQATDTQGMEAQHSEATMEESAVEEQAHEAAPEHAMENQEHAQATEGHGEGAGHGEKAEGEHHASAKDLIYPFINVTLLFGFLFWKLKGPVSNMFTENSVKIQELAELADKKDQEAETQLRSLETKMAEVHNEMHKIVVNAQEDGDRFSREHTAEVKEQIERMKQDAEVKLMSEKAELIREINSKLLDDVINGAKSTIKGDQGLQQKATSNLMARF